MTWRVWRSAPMWVHAAALAASCASGPFLRLPPETYHAAGPGPHLPPPLLEWHVMGTSYLLLNGACSPVSLCASSCSPAQPHLPPPPPQTGNATSADVAAAMAAADPQPGNPALLMSVLPLNQECFGRPDGSSGAPFRCPRPDVSTGLQANWQVVLASALSVLAGQLPRAPPGCQAALE